MRGSAAFVGAGVAWGMLLLPVPAFANLSARLIYVRDASAETCPDETGLRDAVRRRIGYEAFVPWAKTTVIVDVAGASPDQPGGRAFRVKVQLADAHGISRGTQELRSAGNCASAMDAAALAISIALEAEEAAEVSEATSAPSASQAHAQATVPDAPAEVPDAPSPKPAPSPSPENPAMEATPRDAANQPAESALRYRFATGIDALAAIRVTPDTAGGGDLWVEARRGMGSLGLEIQGQAPDVATLSNTAHANILFFAAVVDPCLHIGPVFGCAVGSVGWMQAQGSSVTDAKTGSAVAVAVGPRVGLEVPVRGPLALRLRGDLLVSLAQPGVEIREGSSNGQWSMPSVGGTFAAGLAYRFP